MIKFATSPANVVTDRAGNVLPGRDLQVWTAADGAQITEIYDEAGQLLPGVVTTDQNGRYPFQLDGDRLVVTIIAPDGTMWDVFSADAFRDLSDALDRIDEFLDQPQAGNIALSVTDFNADPTGNTDCVAPFQACINALPAGGRMIIPPGRYKFDGADVVRLKSNITIDGEGATIFKDSLAGHYAVFVALSGAHGYASGVTDVTMRGIRFEGVPLKANLCVLAGNHASRLKFERLTMVASQTRAGHTFDLGGCEDITIVDCTWYGMWNSREDAAPLSEAVQLDASWETAVSFPDPGGYDQLPTRNVTIQRCRFLPYTDPSGTKWPAPVIAGAHFAGDGVNFTGLTVRDVLVEDPAQDPNAEGGDNSQIRGLIHGPQMRNVLIDGLTVRSTTGEGSIRVVMFSSRSVGHLADGTTGGTYPVPEPTRDITIRNLHVEGLNPPAGVDGAFNPVVWINGVDGGPADNINIDATVNGAAGAVHIEKATRVRVAGQTDDVARPVTLKAVQDFTVGPLIARVDTAQPAVITYSDDTSNGSVVAVRNNGYTALTTGTASGTVTAGNS